MHITHLEKALRIVLKRLDKYIYIYHPPHKPINYQILEK